MFDPLMTHPGVVRSLLAVAGATALLLAACTDETPEETPTPTVTPEESPTPDETPEETPDETPEETPTGDAVELELEAEDFAFDQDTLTVPAGARVALELKPRDGGVGHNFALYQDDTGQDPIFRGDIVSQDTTYEFQAPDEPGTYFFRCDVHPGQMTGDFVVE